MGGFQFIANLAASLFLAPTPGLLVLLYVNGGSVIPPLQGIAVMAVSALGYWAWLLNRRNRQRFERAAERSRTLEVERPELFGLPAEGSMAALPAVGPRPAPAPRSRSAEDRRRSETALSGHDDIRDPMADASRRSPGEVLVDRVADLRQLKALTVEHEVGLLNAFYRSVERDEFGAPNYSDWAYEADRFLLSSAFMARILNRHEAIAVVTAEVEALASLARTERRSPRISSDRLLADRREMLSSPRQLSGPATAEPLMLGDPVHAGPSRITMARRQVEMVALAAETLGRHGWTTQATDSPGTDAIDLFAERGELAIGLRCRMGAEPVSEQTVQEVIAARDRFGLDAVGILSRGAFPKAVRALSTVNGVFLLEDEDLNDLHLYVGQRRKVVPLFRKVTAQG